MHLNGNIINAMNFFHVKKILFSESAPSDLDTFT
jgi:hypothetical protein